MGVLPLINSILISFSDGVHAILNAKLPDYGHVFMSCLFILLIVETKNNYKLFILKRQVEGLQRKLSCL